MKLLLLFQEYIVRPTEFSYLTRKWKNRLIEFNNKYNSQSNTK